MIGKSIVSAAGRHPGFAGLGIASLLLAMSTPADAAVDPGQALYLEHCSQCHEGNVPRAPHSILFNLARAEDILGAMNDGPMKQQAAGLSAEEKVTLANYLAGSKTAPGGVAPMLMCADSNTATDADAPGVFSWGMDERSHRHIDAATAGLDQGNVPGLELKWVFDFPGATRARSQPSVYGDVVYVGSQHGVVYAIDLDTGCLHWQFQAEAEVRSAISIAPASKKRPHLLYFGDTAGNVYAVSGVDGKLQWQSHLKDHPDATITGSPRLHGDRLFVPMSSKEWATAADPNYACCTFRGGIAAFDVADGALLWKSYSIPEEPRDSGKRNPLGVPIMVPSGAPVWNSPTVDVKRGLLYVGTGESYTSPAAPTSDAVLAISMDSGKLVWSQQLTAKDAWNMSCFIGSSYNCPEENGPDMDIGAPPVLVTLPSGRDMLVVGQKNGFVYGLDPDNQGAKVWERKVGLGGYAGGIHWGMTTDGKTIFAPNADTDFIGRFDAERFPGVFALDAATGKQIWFTPAEADCREDQKPACDAGMSAAATSIPGVVFAGSFDGQLRAYDSRNGKVLWTFQTNRSFTSVSGREAHGGSIESDGPVVYRGRVLVNSGYLYGSRMPGNVLLSFGLPTEPDQTAREKQ